MDSIDRYLRETARSHSEKNVSRTWVLVDSAAEVTPQPILGFFTLTITSVEVIDWQNKPKGLPAQPLGVVLMGRLGVDGPHQGRGISKRLVELAKQLAFETVSRSGGIGLVVDAANEALIPFYEKFGFRHVEPGGLRLFLPTATLLS